MDAQSQSGQAEALRWLGEHWATALASVIEGMAGERPAVAWKQAADVPVPTPGTEPLRWQQSFDLAAEANLWVALPEEAWSTMGARTLGAAGVDEVSTEEIRGTVLEVLSQSFSALSQAMSERVGRTVATVQGAEAEALPAGLEAGAVEVVFGQESLALIRIVSSEELAGALAETFAPRSLAVQTPEPAMPAPTEARAAGSAALDLLRDVELPVSVSFGRTHLPLQDVLKLAAGSVIELDRSISDPVALIVNNTVFALGEVVVIEGNYGLRVKEIMSREKLLRSSGVL